MAPSIVNVTVPVGTASPLAGLMVAVKVTASPSVLGFSDDWIDVLVEAEPAMQTTLIEIAPSAEPFIEEGDSLVPGVQNQRQRIAGAGIGLARTAYQR